MTYTLHHGDCLEVMAGLPDASVDMILCDLPYGTTACKWDTVIPFEPLWAQYRRVAKRNAAIVLTASQPFTSALVMSNVGWFRYQWVWKKSKAAGFMQAKVAPLRAHEDILVFSCGNIAATAKNKVRYYPQGLSDCERACSYDGREILGARSAREYKQTQTGYPTSVLEIPSASATIHPTQKPVALMEYLIRTYTQEGETVLDNCMGSGTTGVACANTGRQFIGIERDSKYFAIASERIAAAQSVGKSGTSTDTTEQAA